MHPRNLIWIGAHALFLMVAIPGTTGAFSRGPDPLTAAEAARATNDFAWDLYGRLQDQKGNLFFSPASIELALAMTWTGARGQTAVEMGRTLRLPKSQFKEYADVSAAFGKLQQKLIPSEGTTTLNIANRLWGQKGFAFRESYLAQVEADFGAGLQELDFRSDTEASRQTINRWVEDRTQDKIQDLLPVGSIDANIRLVLTNAIYFLGNWQRQFQGSDTKDRPFYLASGDSPTVPTMFQTRRFAYAENDQVQVITLPYRGGEVEMVIVLPKAQDGLARVETDLDQDQLDQWAAGLTETQVRLYLPKFSLAGEFSLAKVLGQMGMALAFSDAADFSGMAEGQGLAISDVIHKSFIDVYEKGTEAAAATAVTIRTTSMPGMDPKAVTFRADHPFLFLLRQADTGTILFLGRVQDPRS